MHLHADHPLFADAKHSTSAVLGRVACVTAVLGVNIAAGSPSLSAGLLVAGVAALWLRRGRDRLLPALAWVGLATMGTTGAALLSDLPADRAATAALRIAAGMPWLLWLGAELDWPSVRATLRRSSFPALALETLDHAVLHGLLTRHAWAQRRDAARLRLGSARMPLAVWSSVLAEGALDAIDRVDEVEAAALLRGARPSAKGSPVEALALRGLHLEAGSAPRLRAIDLSLAAGEWIAVCGPSGAGKSSLLAVVSGLVAASGGGLIRFGEHVPPGASLHRRLDGRIALLAQNPERHFLASTAAEDVAWGLIHRGTARPEAEARAHVWLERLGVAHLADRPVHAMSVGEQRRVGLAGLLVLEPRLLLLDEPTSGLDPLAADALVEAVQHAAALAGAACLWVTHDLHHLPPAARRVVLMRDGRIVYDGPTDEGLRPDRLVAAGLARPDSPSP
ncbi:MAG: energy-coupling factor ABC transporter ATP-binding protein, partial [Deltaproteobacteria bacterium]|nr:energy-coupling factor ABC transporter ATP-binding protein [Deltaproteobacteria bacterium]